MHCDTNKGSMALSVTRHASTPLIILYVFLWHPLNTFGKCNLLFNPCRHTGRESSSTAKTLPNSLPKKDEQYQLICTEVASGRESVQMWGNKLINKLINHTIDQSKQEVYNSIHGKSDRIGGLIKENSNGSI